MEVIGGGMIPLAAEGLNYMCHCLPCAIIPLYATTTGTGAGAAVAAAVVFVV